jgi:50S ribosomal protein L16 3-hydroxylase
MVRAASDQYTPRAVLGGLSDAEFLSRYWQKRPLYVPRALPAIKPPLSRQALLDLSTTEGVQARLVIGEPGKGAKLSFGPFTPRQLRHLPDTHWTVLVQDIEQHVPEARELLEPFSFLPEWRSDDLMVSFAAPGGGVGPHVDQYDVFLIAAEGTRRWQVAEHFDPALQPNSDLRVLQHFTPEAEWAMEPGDLLYLPPGVAHYGVGDTPSMTLSVGFRAPDQTELVCALGQELLEHGPTLGSKSLRFGDAERLPSVERGLLATHERHVLRELLWKGLANTLLGALTPASEGASELTSTEALDNFLGRWLTRPKEHLANRFEPDLENDEGAAGSRSPTSNDCGVRRHEGSRWLYYAERDSLHVFVDGEAWRLPLSCRQVIVALSQGHTIRAETLREQHSSLSSLVYRHCVQLPD